jgi:hypothetical protein
MLDVFWRANDPKKVPAYLASLAFFLAHYLASFISNLKRPEMPSTNEVRTSLFEDAVLQLLLGSSPDREGALCAIQHGLGQSPEPSAFLSQAEQSSHFLTPPTEQSSNQPEDQRSTGRCEQRRHSPVAIRKHSHGNDGEDEQETQRLLDKGVPVERRLDTRPRLGADDGRSQRCSSHLNHRPSVTPYWQKERSWADIPPEERLAASDYNATINWDEDSEESTRPLRQVSENTAKSLKSVFS